MGVADSKEKVVRVNLIRTDYRIGESRGQCADQVGRSESKKSKKVERERGERKRGEKMRGKEKNPTCSAKRLSNMQRGWRRSGATPQRKERKKERK